MNDAQNQGLQIICEEELSNIRPFFRRLKGFRRVFSRFDKLDVMFLGFIVFALVVNALSSVNTP